MGDNMRTATPFSLRIFIVDGDPDGLRLVERSNWIGKAVMFPRALYTQIRNRSEFEQTGVYLLLGPRVDGDGDMLYIGEGDPVRPRIETHHAKKDFWTRAVFFVAGPGQLNKAHVQYLEAQLVKLATAAKRMPLDNGNTPTEPTLSEADKADMDVFLQNILGMLPVLGIHAFEKAVSVQGAKSDRLLHCCGKGISASGHDTPQGFVVRSGSFAAMQEVPSFKKHCSNAMDLRKDLVGNGVLMTKGDKYQFSQDYTFTSPSMASTVVLGRASQWQNRLERCLREDAEEHPGRRDQPGHKDR